MSPQVDTLLNALGDGWEQAVLGVIELIVLVIDIISNITRRD